MMMPRLVGLVRLAWLDQAFENGKKICGELMRERRRDSSVVS
jgi:hypothetical protein